MHEEFFAVIRNEHAQVKDLMSKMSETKEGGMIEELESLLIPHMRGEEASLYPALEEHPESIDDSLEAEEEHHIAEVVLSELVETLPEDRSWLARLKVLKDLLDHHMAREEDEVFTIARKVLSHEDIEEIMQEYMEEKEAAMAAMS